MLFLLQKNLKKNKKKSEFQFFFQISIFLKKNNKRNAKMSRAEPQKKGIVTIYIDDEKSQDTLECYQKVSSLNIITIATKPKHNETSSIWSNLTDNIRNAVFSLLATHRKTLTCIRFWRACFDDAWFLKFISTLNEYTFLKIFDIEDCNCGPQVMHALAEKLSSNRSIIEISIPKCLFHMDVYRKLFASKRVNPVLRSLSISTTFSDLIEWQKQNQATANPLGITYDTFGSQLTHRHNVKLRHDDNHIYIYRDSRASQSMYDTDETFYSNVGLFCYNRMKSEDQPFFHNEEQEAAITDIVLMGDTPAGYMQIDTYDYWQAIVRRLTHYPNLKRLDLKEIGLFSFFEQSDFEKRLKRGQTINI